MALMTYIHNEAEEMLYALPDEPTIEPKQNRYGDTKAWKVSVEVIISTPNNQLKKGRWLIPTQDTLKDEYPLSTKKKDIIRNFRKKHYPAGRNVTALDYQSIKEAYDLQSGR